jgi:hypothetical protein
LIGREASGAKLFTDFPASAQRIEKTSAPAESEANSGTQGAQQEEAVRINLHHAPPFC